MIIEVATFEDLNEIQRLNKMLFDYEHNNFDKTFNLEWTFGEIGTKYFSDSITDENACALVAKDGDKIVGYLVGWMKDKDNPCRVFKKQAELENMFISEEYRGKNVGSKLVERFIDWAKKSGAGNIRVATAAKNDKAIAFYRKCGFEDFEAVLEKKI